jgi:hypothetical protein
LRFSPSGPRTVSDALEGQTAPSVSVSMLIPPAFPRGPA